MSNVTNFPRHGQLGYYALADLPQAPPLDECAYSAGWWELDKIWKLYPGQFSVVTGLPGHGKSTFLLNVVCNVAKQHGTRTFMYVPENERSIKAQLERIWGADKGFDQFSREQCFIHSAEPDDYDQRARTIEWVLDKAKVSVEKDEADIVLIDPWNELERAKPKEEMLTDYIGRCLQYLKQMTRKYNVSVIMVAHPTKAGNSDERSRDGKIRGPGLADIEGSMGWYNKCDNGLIVVREPQATRVVSAKVRLSPDAGQRGQCHFDVDKNTGIFTPQYGEVE